MLYFIEYFHEGEVDPCDLTVGCTSITQCKERATDVAHQHKYTKFRISRKRVGNTDAPMPVGIWALRWRRVRDRLKPA